MPKIYWWSLRTIKCLSPLKLCHYLMVTGGFKVGTETVFGRRCSKGFANLYNDIADIISGINDNGLVPDLSAGLDGMWFITSCLESSQADGAWVARS